MVGAHHDFSIMKQLRVLLFFFLGGGGSAYVQSPE